MCVCVCGSLFPLLYIKKYKYVSSVTIYIYIYEYIFAATFLFHMFNKTGTFLGHRVNTKHMHGSIATYGMGVCFGVCVCVCVCACVCFGVCVCV